MGYRFLSVVDQVLSLWEHSFIKENVHITTIIECGKLIIFSKNIITDYYI